MPTIIPANDNGTPLEHGTAFIDSLGNVGFGQEPPDCPWVQVRNLYLSVTQTGPTSWPPLVRQLQQGGARTFTILSGRHGTQIGQAVDNRNGRMHDNLFERALYVTDNNHAGTLGIAGLEVIDASLPQYRSTGGLRTLVQAKLGAGRVVILAWCHSLFSMAEYDGDAPMLVLRSHLELSVRKSVATIVAESYRWVP